MSFRTAGLIILAFTLWRLVSLGFDHTDLFVDEAQYWLWSQHLDFGYYSKPPMIAWAIRAVTDLARSDAIYAIRASGPPIHMATAFVLMAATRRIAEEKVAGWVGASYITLPAVGLGSYLFSTDTLLIFFMAVALWAYFGLTERRSLGLALTMGIGIGAAFLSKYAVLFILPGGAAALMLLPSARISGRDFLVAVAAAALVAAPNLQWNLSHDITTVRHTQDIAHWSALRLDLMGGLEFVATQFAVTGPILFAALAWAGLRALRGAADDREALLVWLSLPIVILITLQAVFAKAYGNWAATAYIAGTIAAVWLLKRHWPRGLVLSLAINGVVCAVFPLAYIFPHSLKAPNGNAAMMRNLGRAEVSLKAADLAEAAHQGVIVADNRDILADLFYTLRDRKLALYARPPAAFPKNYYEQTLALPQGVTGPILFITLAPFDCAAEPPSELASWTPESGNYRSRTIYAFQTVPACLDPPG